MNINFRTSMWECRPRILWQGLFDIYRQCGGSLDHMDNILIDLKNCQDVFVKLNPDRMQVHFLWGFAAGDRSFGDTEWTWLEDESAAKSQAQTMVWPYVILGTLSRDDVSLEFIVNGETK